MNRKVSVSLSQKNYDLLAELSDFYKQSIERTINDIVDALQFSCETIKRLSKEYKVPTNLAGIILDLLEMGDYSYKYLFGEVLERLGAKGLFKLVDLDITPEDNYTWLSYAAMRGCNLYIDEFDVTLSPPSISATYTIETEKTESEALERLKKIVQNIEEDLELPEDFYDVDYDVYIDDTIEEFWSLVVNCSVDDFNYLPDLNVISDLIRQILKKAGILHKS
ncbi:hypothetical protein CW702_02335 [Candidatus Bathyarchaeota archaeon]|nr:MAG: hypothetical protein CW702_02335 [Candidatus Bathyarchaeota archaeon]